MQSVVRRLDQEAATTAKTAHTDARGSLDARNRE
jgi:hypothetical protein